MVFSMVKGFLQEIDNFIWVSSLHWHGFGLNSRDLAVPSASLQRGVPRGIPRGVPRLAAVASAKLHELRKLRAEEYLKPVEKIGKGGKQGILGRFVMVHASVRCLIFASPDNWHSLPIWKVNIGELGRHPVGWRQTVPKGRHSICSCRTVLQWCPNGDTLDLTRVTRHLRVTR